ncbi:hypothetical protein D3C72_2334690 [compost metagenome]
MFNHSARGFFNHRLNNRVDNRPCNSRFGFYGLRLFAFLDLLSHLNNVFGEGFSFSVAVSLFFGLDYRRRFNGRFWL